VDAFFPEKVIVFKNLKKSLESFFPVWLPTTHTCRYNHKSSCD